LCLQARRKSIDVRRANGSRARREVSVTGVEPTDSDDAAAWSMVWSASVRSAVRTLDTAQSRPIELAFFQGHSYREVAEILGEPEGTVKSRIRAGLHKLRAVLLAPEASDSTAMAPPTSARVPS
jgi:RNA polymerase sigma-70 factor (ECF subfamily)